MIPDSNNVCGIVTAPNGLQPVLKAINTAFADCRAYIKRSQFNGAETLHVRGESIDFDSDPLSEESKHLFNGGVGGAPQRVVELMQKLSNAFSAAGIEHSLEVYDGEKLVQVIQGR
jgi:hypothetical protein